MSRKRKAFILALSAAAAALAAGISYSQRSAHLTPFQRAQEVSFEKNTGATKFKAIADALCDGGFAFIATAAVCLLTTKFHTKK